MNSLEKLVIGKYYQIPNLNKVQYVGKSDDNHYFIFVRKNIIGLKNTIRRTFFALNGENIPILLQNDEDNDTDNEYPDE